ncbi:MAG: AMP-binding protein [Alistipes sp.]|nr:AMP-binding protein [Alistipes sp.]MBQ5785375.1 AMP-binding protein [Alistipes sp.]
MRHYLSILQTTMRENWEKPVLSDYRGETFTFADMASQMARLHRIFDAAGVEAGDRVALAAKNSARWAMAFLSIATYRGVAVSILADFNPIDVAGLVNHSESKVLFIDPKIWESMNTIAMPELKAVINVEDYSPIFCVEEISAAMKRASVQAESFSAAMKEAVTNYQIGELDDLSIINYTSGTTSSPKGVMLSARNISSNIEFGLRNIPIQKGDQIMSMLPLAHMYGMAFEFLYPLCGGCHIYFLGKTPTPTILMQALADIKPYLLITVPLVLEKIFKGKVMPTLNKPVMRVLTSIPGVKNLIYGKVYKQLMGVFGGNIRSFVIGGAAISRPVEKVMRAVKLPYTVGYGMTECGPLIGYSPWDTFRLGSCGRAVDNVEVRIDSDDPAKIVGEIQVKGDNVMQGYFKNPEATAATFTEDGYLRTGDLGIIDKQGNIFIKGRSKCMILSPNGQNIYPEEIESKLNSMPHVAESLIVDRGHALVAIVALSQEDQKADREELMQVMEQNRVELNKVMPAYSKISKIEIIEEGFEHTPKQSIKRFMYK